MRPRLYGELADWWQLVSPPEDYAEEAKLYAELLRDRHEGDARLTALELGSGGGHCAWQMRQTFTWTLTDLSPRMLDQSRRLHPHVEHLEGDMRTLRLNREFDAVFVHDSINHMTTTADLEATMRTAFVHCRPGGTALFVPDFVRETFRAGTDQGGSDGDGRALRYFEWLHEPPSGASEARVDLVLLLRENQTTRVVHDHHRYGVFSRDVWHRLLQTAGFDSEERAVPPDHRPLFVARRAP